MAAIPDPKRVAVIGGSGLFGSRLCDLLVRDGHQVIAVGRSAASVHVARDLGCDHLRWDRTGDMAALWALKPDVVVDAAGPFQSYGEDPLRLPKACLAQGVHYLDLSDSTAFCAQFDALDHHAKDAGVGLWSRVSTVPCLSAGFVDALRQGLDLETVDIAILPGNRTPRGRSVTHSIMAQAGTEFDVVQGGVSLRLRNWSRARWFDLPKGHRRKARLFDLPDRQLMPMRQNVPTVRTWAGLELGLLDFGLLAFAKARSWGLPFAGWMVDATLLVARVFERMGTNVGGMGVEVTGWHQGQAVQRSANFIVEHGLGPYVPGVPVRAILRKTGGLPVGAGAATGLLTKDDIISAMSDLPLVIEETETPITPLFPSVLGPAYQQLPRAVADSHKTIGVHHYTGISKVTRGGGAFARVLAWAFGFPAATRRIDVTVTKTATPDGETWVRSFGASTFMSKLSAKNGAMREQFGPFSFELGLNVQDGGLNFPVRRGFLGPVPLPAFCLPTSQARETERDGKLCFDVKLLAPITQGMIVWYQGELRPVAKETHPS